MSKIIRIDRKERNRKSEQLLTYIKNWKWLNIRNVTICYSDEWHYIANSMLNMSRYLFSTLFAFHFSWTLVRCSCAPFRLCTHQTQHSLTDSVYLHLLICFSSGAFQQMFNISSSLHSLYFLVSFSFFAYFTFAIWLSYKSKVIYVVHIFRSFAVSFALCHWSLFERKRRK